MERGVLHLLQLRRRSIVIGSLVFWLMFGDQFCLLFAKKVNDVQNMKSDEDR